MMRQHPPDTTDDQLVADYVAELSRNVPPPSGLPSPSFIWWKAQLLRRLDAERDAAAPIEVGDAVHVALAALGAVALGVGGWSQLPNAPSAIVAAAIGAGGLVVVAVVTIAVIGSLRDR